MASSWSTGDRFGEMMSSWSKLLFSGLSVSGVKRGETQGILPSVSCVSCVSCVKRGETQGILPSLRQATVIVPGRAPGPGPDWQLSTQGEYLGSNTFEMFHSTFKILRLFYSSLKIFTPVGEERDGNTMVETQDTAAVDTDQLISRLQEKRVIMWWWQWNWKSISKVIFAHCTSQDERWQVRLVAWENIITWRPSFQAAEWWRTPVTKMPRPNSAPPLNTRLSILPNIFSSLFLKLQSERFSPEADSLKTQLRMGMIWYYNPK